MIVYNPYATAMTMTVVGTPRGATASSSDPSFTRVIPAQSTLPLTDVYAVLHPSGDGVDQFLCTFTDPNNQPLANPPLTVRTYNSQPGNQEFGANIPAFDPDKDYRTKGTTLVGLLGKNGARDALMISTPPAGQYGATSQYGAIILATIRTSSGQIASRVTYTVPPGAFVQTAPNMPELLDGSPKPDDGSLEITIQEGALYSTIGENNGVTSDPTIKALTVVPTAGLPAPRILGLDYENDGVVDNPALANGLLENVTHVTCEAKLVQFQAWVVATDGKRPYNFSGRSPPAGMTVAIDGQIDYNPPCTDKGKSLTVGLDVIDAQLKTSSVVYATFVVQ